MTLSMKEVSWASRRCASAMRSLDASRPVLNRTSPCRRKSGFDRQDLESCIVWWTPSSRVTRCFLGWDEEEDEEDRLLMEVEESNLALWDNAEAETVADIDIVMIPPATEVGEDVTL